MLEDCALIEQENGLKLKGNLCCLDLPGFSLSQNLMKCLKEPRGKTHHVLTIIPTMQHNI